MGRKLRFLALGLSLCLTTLSTTAAGLPRPALDFPLPVDSYHDQQIPSLFGKITGRIQREPLNLVATIIFLGAIVHTFLVNRFGKIAHNYQQSYEAIEYLLHATDGPPDFGKKHDKLLFRAQLFYFMGEVEAVFGIWLIPLFVAIIAFHRWSTMVDYVGTVNVSDAIFVVVIMAIASSLPIIGYGKRDRKSFGDRKGNTCFVVVGNSDPRRIARFLHHGTGCHDDLRPSTAPSFL
jgi:Putative Na+/H+ antiporter